MFDALIVEDNPLCAECLCDIVHAVEGRAVVAKSLLVAEELIARKKFQIILLDLNLDSLDGFALLEKIASLRLDAKTIVISGSLGVAETVKAMKLGAAHCFPKPIIVKDLIAFLDGTVRGTSVVCGTGVSNDSINSKRNAGEPRAPGPQIGDDDAVDLIGNSEPMLRVKQSLRNLARARKATIIITGETGTGKEVVARRLHDRSRPGRPFVAVNSSAIPASLIESELFGHEKGAFTDARSTRRGYFEMAGDGTLFLDEIGDLPLEYQGKLLRALQERSFRRVGGQQEIALNASVIAATNVDLAEAVRRGKFREDLYYRLSVIPIHLPPLRERGEDILLIAAHYLQLCAAENDCPPQSLGENDKRLLLSHAWPGNIRELRNVMERCVLLGRVEIAPAGRSCHAPQAPSAAKAPASFEGAPIDADEERRTLYSFVLRMLKATPVEAAAVQAPVLLTAACA